MRRPTVAQREYLEYLADSPDSTADVVAQNSHEGMWPHWWGSPYDTGHSRLKGLERRGLVSRRIDRSKSLAALWSITEDGLKAIGKNT